MHVLYANESLSPQIDGVAVCAENYARIINEKYGTSSLLVPRHEDRAEGDFNFELLQCPSAKLTFINQYKVCLPMSLDIKNRIEKMPLDIVHSHSPFITGIISMKIAKQKNIPYISTFHSKYKDDVNLRMKFNMDLPGEMVAKYVASFYNKCDYVWTLNKSTANTLSEYGYKGDVIIMPNGCDMPVTYRDEDVRKEISLKYKVAYDKPIFLFVGRITKIKNIDMIINALAALKRRKMNFSMLFVGSGEDEEEMKDLAAKVGLKNEIKFIGKIMDRDELRKIYSSSDLFVFPSVYDNAPLVVREAAACGLPSLLIKGSNSAEGIIDGSNGILVEERLEDIALAICDAVKSANLRKMGEQARDTIYITWSDVVDKVAIEYERILTDYKKRSDSKKSKISLYDIDLKKDFNLKIVSKLKKMYKKAKSKV